MSWFFGLPTAGQVFVVLWVCGALIILIVAVTADWKPGHRGRGEGYCDRDCPACIHAEVGSKAWR